MVVPLVQALKQIAEAKIQQLQFPVSGHLTVRATSDRLRTPPNSNSDGLGDCRPTYRSRKSSPRQLLLVTFICANPWEWESRHWSTSLHADGTPCIVNKQGVEQASWTSLHASSYYPWVSHCNECPLEDANAQGQGQCQRFSLLLLSAHTKEPSLDKAFGDIPPPPFQSPLQHPWHNPVQ